MVEFVFMTALMVCLSTVLYLMVRALPRIVEDPNERKGFLDRWAHSEVPEKIDVVLNGFLFRFLRRLKITILKFDSTIGNRLQKIREWETEYAKKSNIDFRKLNELGAERRMEDRRKPSRRAGDRSERVERKDDNLPV